MSRVVSAFIPRASSPYNTSPQSSLASSTVKPVPPDSRYFSLFAALAWGSVMWLFQNRGETIQPGMFNSMKYLYRDSETWKSLRTLLWHNDWERRRDQISGDRFYRFLVIHLPRLHLCTMRRPTLMSYSIPYLRRAWRKNSNELRCSIQNDTWQQAFQAFRPPSPQLH